MFWRKKRETLWGHISQKSSSRIFWAGWLFPKNVPNISSDTIPLQSCWRYLPPIVLAEISLTPEYVQTGQFFLYTKQNLHQKNFYTKELFHQKRLYTKQFLHQEPLIRKGFYTRNLYHHRHLTPNIFFHIYIYAYTRKLLQKNTADYFYSRNLIHQRGFTP